MAKCTPLPSYEDSAGIQQRTSVIPGLTFKDFYPECIKAAGITTEPTYALFPDLMKQANEFLQTNPQLEVKSCESAKFVNQFGSPEYQKMAISENDAIPSYTRCLRLWLVERSDRSLPPQKIGYYDNVPQKVNETSKYESLDTLLERMNDSLKNHPLTGRILNVETQELRFRDFSSKRFNPDFTFWRQVYDFENHHFMYILRVFYEVGPPMFELIGCIDFVPRRESAENFTDVIHRASRWCAQKANVKYCNAQTINCKTQIHLSDSIFHNTQSVDTKCMYYLEDEREKKNSYVRFLRIVYTIPHATSAIAPSSLYLTSKLFKPVQLSTGGISIPKFEKLDLTKVRLNAWFEATRASIVTAETVIFKFFHDLETESRLGGFDDTNIVHCSGDPHYITAFRVYLDGHYEEPPSEVLPEIPPDLEDDSCCDIL